MSKKFESLIEIAETCWKSWNREWNYCEAQTCQKGADHKKINYFEAQGGSLKVLKKVMSKISFEDKDESSYCSYLAVFIDFYWLSMIFDMFMSKVCKFW